MPVAQETPIASYTANGATTLFPYAFTVLQAADLVVQGVFAGITTVYTLGVHYTLSGVGTPSGSVTFLAAPVNGTVITVYRNSQLSRSIDYQTNGDLLANTIDLDFDRIWLALQEIFSGGKGPPTAVRVPNGETIAPLPAAAARAGFLLGFDGAGALAMVATAAQSASALALSLLSSAGSTFVSFLQAGTGAVLRTLQSKLRDSVSVTDFGAVGDGTTDDTTAIQNAFNTGKTVYFPKPASFYKVTAAIVPPANPRAYGDLGVTTIIRRTNGAGGVFDFPGGSENGCFEHLRIGGAGSTGITCGGGGYANYLSTLSLRNVHFEADLLVGVNANLIHCNFVDTTFGYFQQISVNPNLQHVVSVFSGGNNTNINKFDNVKFFNGSATAAAVSFTGGLLLTFINCAWENNGRDLQTSNVQDVRIIGGYTERGKHATSQFDFGASRNGVRIDGMQANGSANMPAGASMFRAPSATPLVLKEVDVSTTASAFGYQDSTTSAHFPTSLHDILTDNRWQGNAADPLLPWDNVRTGAPVAFTPNANGFTIVNGTGGVTHAGKFSVVGRIFKWQITSTVTGTATIAAPGGGATNYFDGFPTNVTPIRDTFSVTDDSAAVINGVGLSYINGRHYPPAFSARNASVTYSGTFQF